MIHIFFYQDDNDILSFGNPRLSISDSEHGRHRITDILKVDGCILTL